MTLATWPNKLSLTCIPHNQQHSLAFIHGQNCLSGNCGIQHHKPRDPGGVSPTQASGHRHTHLGPGCGPWSGPWTCSKLPQPLSPAAWVPLESTALDNHLPTRKPLWKPRFPKAKFQHTVGTKIYIYKFGHIGEGKKNSLTLPMSPSRQGSTAQGQVISPTGENEGMWVSAWLPQPCGTLPKRLIFPSPHPEYWIMSHMTGDGKGWGSSK